MAVIQDGTSGTLATVSSFKAMRTVSVPLNYGAAVNQITGTVAAALALNSTVYAMRLNPGATVSAFINRVRLRWNTVAAFTTPVTAGRRIAVFRGTGAAASGGTGVATASLFNSASATSQFNAANGGDIRIATTAGLTVTGITYEAEPFLQMPLTHVGAAGGFYDFEWVSHRDNAIVLAPGQLLAVRNPVAMDAAGTWTLQVLVEWNEAPLYES